MAIRSISISLLILYWLPIIVSCQGSEKVIEYEMPERIYEDTVQAEYIKSANPFSIQKRDLLLKECASLSSNNQYDNLSLDIKKSECLSVHGKYDHLQNFMNLIVEWILEEKETLDEQGAITEVLKVRNMKKLIELELNKYLRECHCSEAFANRLTRQKLGHFIQEINQDNILLSDTIYQSPLTEIKSFTFSIRDWALNNESNELHKVIYGK